MRSQSYVISTTVQPHCCQVSLCARLASSQHQRSSRVVAFAQPECLAQMSSQYNPAISVWSIPDEPQFPPEMRNSVILTLDNSGNVHSLHRQNLTLTGAYWDALTLLPAVIPPGPVIILGLGAGTIAHLVHHFYADRQMHGWELDPAVLAVGQQHMGLQQLQDAGCLVAHVGDALADSAAVQGGAAGIIVDLFADGQLIPQLTQPAVWQSIKQRLGPGGRVMVNLGHPPGMAGTAAHAGRTLAALDALAEAFEGELICSVCGSEAAANMMAITGPPPSAEDWERVPQQLQQHTKGARFFGWQPYSKYKERLSESFFEW